MPEAEQRRYRVVAGWEKAPANANRLDAVGVGVDSRGARHVGEVTDTIGVRPGLVPADCHTFQKFEPA